MAPDDPQDPPGHFPLGPGSVLAIVAASGLAFAALFAGHWARGLTLSSGDAFFISSAAYEGPGEAWTRTIFSGFPAFADPPSHLFFPLRDLARATGTGLDLLIWSGYALAAASAGVLVLAMTGSRTAAAVAGVVFSFNAFATIRLGHPSVVQSLAWMPLPLLALRRLAGSGGTPWIALGALAVAGGILGGHPQTTAYGLALAVGYAAFLGLAVVPRDRRVRFALAAAAMLALGVGLVAIQLVPTLELLSQTRRAAMAPEKFFGFSLPLLQLSMLVFPGSFGGLAGPLYGGQYFGKGNLSELSGWLGLLGPALAAVALARIKGPRRAEALFFAGVALLSVLAALGPDTPLGHLLVRTPGYKLFQSQARHLVTWALAIAVLAGLGAQAAAQGTEDERRAAFALATKVGLGLLALAYLPLLLGARVIAARAADRGVAWSAAPWANPALGIPVLGLGVALAGLWVWCRAPGRAGAVVLLAGAVLELGAVSLFTGLPHATRPRAIEALPAALAARLAPCGPAGQRVFPVLGQTWKAEWLAGNTAQLWGIPCAGGYQPLGLERYLTLMGLHVNGTARPPAFRHENQAFDLIALRYLLVPDPKDFDTRMYQREGLEWPFYPMEQELTREAPEVTLRLPGVRATRLGIVAARVGSPGVPDQDPVLEVRLAGAAGGAGRVLTVPAGEFSWSEGPTGVRGPIPAAPGARLFGRETLRDEAGAAFESLRSLAVRELNDPEPITSLTLRWVGPAAAGLRLDYLSLGGAAGDPGYPVGAGHLIRGRIESDPRWRRVEGEFGIDLFERVGAGPGARLVTQVAVAPFEAIRRAVWSGRLPDGSAFDPARTVLLEEPLEGPPPGPGPPGTLVAEFGAGGAGRIRVEAATDSILVLADSWYPGWWARVDGREVGLLRANGFQLALRVPAGAHEVEVGFAPASLAIGRRWTGLAGLACLFLAWPRRRAFPPVP